jgi:hypothetical protein
MADETLTVQSQSAQTPPPPYAHDTPSLDDGFSAVTWARILGPSFSPDDPPDTGGGNPKGALSVQGA